MKNMICLLLIGLLLSFSHTTYAQTQNGDFVNGTSTPFYTNVDTVTNAAADTLNYTLAGYVRTITFQVNEKYISGTTSSNTIKLQASADKGSNYVTLYTDTVGTGSTTVSHAMNYNPYTNYRVIITGSGTQVSSYQAYVLIR